MANNRLKAAPSAIKPEVGPETLGVKAGNDADSRIFDEGAALDAARPKEKRTHLSDSEIAEADRAYKLCPSIVSKRVSDHGRKVRMLHFPSRPIGAVSSADNKVSDRPAKGDFYIDPGTVLSLNVDASKCAAIDLPDIFKKIGAGEFTALTLQCRRDRDTSQQTPSDKSEGQRLTSILQTVSSWSHLSALNIFDADINEAVLTALDDMKSLTTVEFHRCIWKSQDIRRRPFISRLTVLQLDDVHNAGQIIRCLAGSSNIRQLKLFNLEVSKEALLELNSCPKFSQLDLQDILTDDNFLKALTQIKTLRNVKISPSLSKEQLAILVGGPHAIAIDDRGYSLQQRQEFNRSVPGLRWERQ